MDRYRSQRIVAIVAVGVMAVSGCSRLTGHKPSAAASTTDPGSAGAGTDGQGVGGGSVPSSAPPVAPSPAGPQGDVLADGRSASYLKAVNVSNGTLTFDLIQLLFGKDATAAWVKTHPNEPDGPPEGYLLVNDNPKLRTMSLAPDVTVKVIDLNASNPSVARPIKLTDLPSHLAGERNAPLPYWLTVANGRIAVIEEEYLA